MTSIQVRHAPTPFGILSTNLSDLIALPDPAAALAMNERMGALEMVSKLHERSYSERGIIAREFERRRLWQHLVDPETDLPFPHFTAWASCSNFLACRRIIFESKKDMELLQDVPTEKLIDVPKGNLKVLAQLSTAVRNDPAILEAARSMDQDKFMEKMEREQPNQHIESRRPLRFSPDRTGAKIVEEMIAYALDNDIAGSRDEAIVRACETALHEWGLEKELRDMPAEENTAAVQ